MSNSTFQSLLMESGSGLPPPEPACEYDPYYNTGPVNDPYWADVVALLHFDGSLTDSSSVGAVYTNYSTVTTTTNARFGESLSVTRNTTQGVVSPLSTNYDVNSGDFTIELWFRPSLLPIAASTAVGIFDSSGNREYIIEVSNTTGDNYRAYYPTGAGTTASILGLGIADGVWMHLAFARVGDTYNFFCDGRLVSTATNSYRRATGTKYLRIGNNEPNVSLAAVPGLYDEVRVTKGTARYTNNFAYDNHVFPDALETDWSPTDPRTVLSLTGEPLRIIDEVLNVPGTIDANDTVTYNGEIATPTISDATAVSYGAGGITFVADNTNNYITYSASSKLNPLNYFEIVEYKVTATYAGTLSGTGGPINIIRVSTSTTYMAVAYVVQSGVMRLYLYVRTPTTSDTTYTDVAVPTTTVIALQFNKRLQTGVFLMDGRVIRTPGSIGTSFGPLGLPNTSAVRIGPDAQASRGGITSVTIKDFQVNTYYQEDAAGYQPQRWYPNVNTVDSITFYKFGIQSYELWNTGSSSATRRYALAITNELLFSDGDFTLDMWAYRLANTYTGRLWTYATGLSGYVEVNTSGALNVYWLSSGGGQTRAALATISLNEWVHFAFQRRGTLLETYVNGVLVDSVAITGGASSTIDPTIFAIGASNSTSADTTQYNGYIDAVRLLKGAARYSGNFTPPDLPTCDDSDPGTVIPTSGTDYPRGEAATIQTGQITLANHYQPLSGQRVFVDQGGIGLAQYPLPSGNTATYTVTKTLASSAATTTTVQGRLTWGTDGTFTFVNPENGVGTTTTWLSPTGAGASGEYEFRLEIIDNPNNVVTPYALPFEQYNEVVIDQIIPAYTDITLTEDEESKIHTLQLQVDIKPKTGSAVAGQPGYVDSWLLTLNFLLTKPAIPVPVYPNFDSGTKVNSESGNVFTWYFNPNGTITSGVINGTQVGRWIDAFDDVAKAAEYRLVVYSDPLPGGFQRVSPPTLIGANMGTSARVRHVDFGNVGSELYVGFTLRVYPLLTNPRYNEANYFGQYTFTMVIPQISGF